MLMTVNPLLSVVPVPVLVFCALKCVEAELLMVKSLRKCDETSSCSEGSLSWQTQRSWLTRA